ncbi:carbohydrate ABC transporter permease [Microbacterium tumbae]
MTHPMALTQSRVSRTGGLFIIGLATLLVVFPLVWVIRLSFRPRDAYLADPSGVGGGFTLENFIGAWQNGLGLGMLNSIIVIPLGAAIATVLATACGFALAKMRVPLRRLIMGVLACTFAVPVTSLAVPLFDQALQFGYLGTYTGLSLVYAALFTGWGTLFMTAYYQGFPDELLEASAVDGAGPLRSFVSIVLPLGAPALVTVFVMNFFMMWSDIIIALVMMPASASQTIAAVVASMPSARESNATTSAAAAVIMLIPVLVLFLASQRWLRSEVLAGAVKS